MMSEGSFSFDNDFSNDVDGFGDDIQTQFEHLIIQPDIQPYLVL